MGLRNCPKCRGFLGEKEVRGVVHDRCSTCKGMWIDGMSLDALLGKESRGRDLLGAGDFLAAVRGETTMCLCPRCREPLARSAAGGVELEWCERCHGLFLDAGELEEIQARRRDQRREDREGMIDALKDLVRRALWVDDLDHL